MEAIKLIFVQIVHKEMVLAGVMKIANGSMDSVDLKISAKGIVALIDPIYHYKLGLFVVKEIYHCILTLSNLNPQLHKETDESWDIFINSGLVWEAGPYL